MENYWIVRWAVMLVSLSQGLGWRLETEETVTALMLHHTTLTCQYTGPASEWMFMRWQKILNDSHSVDLAFLRNSYPNAPQSEWSALAPQEFRDHVTMIENVMETNTTFDLRIDGMRCADRGEYRCHVFTLSGEARSDTSLIFQAYPEMPVIDTDSLEVSENSTFSIECYGKLGLPPANLLWQMKSNGDNEYAYVIQGSSITQTNSPSTDCIEQGVSHVTLTMTPELDGAVIQCYAESPLPDYEPMSDETMLLLHRPTTVPPPTVSTPACAGDECVTIVDDDSSAGTMKTSPCLLFSSFLVLIILKTWRRAC